MSETILKGVVFFYSETGTEGGYWAFQDNQHIQLGTPSFGISNNTTVYNRNKKHRKGKTSNCEIWFQKKWVPFPDPMQKDNDYRKSSLYKGEIKGDHEADRRLMEKYGFKIKYAEERLNERYGVGNWESDGDVSKAILKDGTKVHCGVTPYTEPHRPYGVPKNGITRVTVHWEDGDIEKKCSSETLLAQTWDYEGLYILKNGDQLRIKEPNSERIVWEGIIDLFQFPLFTEEARGMWIHADQKGLSRNEWSKYFFEEYPAELVKKRYKK